MASQIAVTSVAKLTSKKRRKVWRAQYRAQFPKGDKLAKVGRLIDWEAFRPILEPLFKNNGEGRPHVDVVLMTKVLVLQSWYGLADGAVETECVDRLTFQNFLGYPEKVPDQNTIWLFRERISQQGKEKELWDELQRQLKKYKVRVKKGKMEDVVLIELGGWRAEGLEGPIVPFAPHTGFAQDSTIIEADAGLPTEEDVKRREEAKKKREEGKKKKEQQPEAALGTNPEPAASTPPTAPDSATTKTEAAQNHEEKTAANGSTQQNMKDGATPTPPVTTTTTAAAASVPAATAPKIETKPRGEEAFTRRSRDGTWTKKHERSYFGYKLHTKPDLSTGFISAFEVTTASVNDNSIDLTEKGEPCVRDRGYTDPGRGHCLSMIRAKAGKPLSEKDKEMNRFISKIRGPVEHPYAVMKRIFHAGRVLVTTIARVKVKETFVCTCYNLFRAYTLSK